MREWIGALGHLSVIIAFVSALTSGIGWFKTQVSNSEYDKKSWQTLAAGAFGLHAVAIFSIVVCLFFIIHNHYYEFHYAWSHSSNNLPVEYMISCFWEGQEGSFLLWLFWNGLLGMILMATNKFWKASVLTVVSAVQVFLASMILGVVIGGSLKIGSSPFILMRDAMPNIPVFTINPNYIPKDGRGLNPLLQNYWMVIHPPTLFLGFALTMIPFAYAISGLWLGKYKEWIRPALPWSLVGALILGTGILMGGYWAYETLNFGGYWNWDPVENAVYVPWLVLVASIHTMIIYRKSGTALSASFILVIAVFLLVLYATFLTRSGILGNASVHSFTDLGLSGQLLIYLLFFLFGAIGLFFFRWKNLPKTAEESNVYSREFWIFMGVTVLGLAAFQVLATTSIPVYNNLLKAFGFEGNLAPPADQVQHYSAWQLWFSAGIALLSAIGQYFYWGKMDKATLWKSIQWPLYGTLGVSALIIAATSLDNWTYLILAITAVFSLVANGVIFFRLAKNSPALSGGAITHMGIAMMLLGVLYSSGYSKVVSVNNSGLIYRKEFSEEMNRDNVLLWKGAKTRMGDLELIYKGDCKEVIGFPTFVKKEYLAHTDNPWKSIARADLEFDGKVYFKKGDTVRVQSENTYYAVEYRNISTKDTFVLYPRAQVNPSMGLLASPDIKRFWNKDLYTHVSSIPPSEEEKEWKQAETHTLVPGDTFIVNDYVAEFLDVSKVPDSDLAQYGNAEAGAKASIRILGTDQNYIAEPIFLIKGTEIARVSGTLGDLGVRFNIIEIDPKTGSFTIGVETSQKDWIIMKALEKPYINVLWIGTLVTLLGFAIACFRRYKEFIQMRDKLQEA